MNSRERLLTALNHQEPDRVPYDLASTQVTGIQIKAYKGLRNMGLKPKDLLVSKVLVIPPAFRPISITSDFEIVADANMLYKDLMDAKDNYSKLHGLVD